MSTSLLLTNAEVAAWLRRPPRTLTQWRYRGVGPAYVKVGGAVLYDRSDVEKWLAEQRVDFGATADR